MTPRAADPARQEALAARPMYGVVTSDDVARLAERNKQRAERAIAALGAKYVCHQPINRKEVTP